MWTGRSAGTRRADVLIAGDRIAAIGPRVGEREAGLTRLDADGAIVIPGFVQTHVHLCQTLFRGLADDLPLLEWLRRRIFPLEAAHDERSLRACTRLACAELICSGTTAFLSMETVHHADVIFEEVAASGLHATGGKCLIDRGSGLPRGFRETTRRALTDCFALADRWHGAADGRIRWAVAPRFAPSCTDRLLRDAAAEAARRDLVIHTHASESRDEIALVHRQTGRSNIEHLADVGIAGPRACLAHVIHVTPAEVRRLARSRTRVTHCPSSNLKLGSGVAPVATLLRAGVNVSLGADGAACNNRLDPIQEMRLACFLQAVTVGPGTLPAEAVLRMATIDGARALGLEAEMGTLERGKLANVAVVDLRGLAATPAPDPVAALVYSASAEDVRHTVASGRVLMQDRRLTGYDVEAIRAEATTQRRRVVGRAGLRV